MAKLPEVHEMREALVKGGISELDLDKEIDKMESAKPIYRKSRKLMYKRLCDKHKIDLNIQYAPMGQAEGEYTKVSELTSDKKLVNIRGYILNIPEAWETKSESLMTVITFADETGAVGITVFQKGSGASKDLIDRLADKFQNVPAPAYITNVSTGEYQQKMSVNIPPFAKFQKIGLSDFDLPTLEKVYESFANSETEFEEGVTYVFFGLLADFQEGTKYIGCPVCKKKLEVEEGERTNCENCSKGVKAKEYIGVSIMIGDEHGEIGIGFPEFTNVTLPMLRGFTKSDPQPEVIVGTTYSKEYELTGSWITPLGDIEIEKGTGRQIIKQSIDVLDFSKDEGRLPLKTDEEDPEGLAHLEELIQSYETKIKFFGSLTPDELAEFLQKNLAYEKEYKIKPVIDELLKRNKISIVGDKIKKSD